MVALAKAEGWQALFGGIKPALIGTAASQGIYFFMYQKLRHAIVSRRKNQDVSALESLYVSMVAGAVNVCITQPIWTVVTRLQTKRRSGVDVSSDGDGGMIAECQALLDEGGIKAFYRGYARPAGTGAGASERVGERDSRGRATRVDGCIATDAASVPHPARVRNAHRLIPNLVMVSNPAVQFVLIEQLSARVRKAKGVRSDAKLMLTPLETFSQGALAKVGATLITYPVQLIKSRMQAERRSKVRLARAGGEDEGGGRYNSISRAQWGCALTFCRTTPGRHANAGRKVRGLRQHPRRRAHHPGERGVHRPLQGHEYQDGAERHCGGAALLHQGADRHDGEADGSDGQPHLEAREHQGSASPARPGAPGAPRAAHACARAAGIASHSYVHGPGGIEVRRGLLWPPRGRRQASERAILR